MPDPVFPVIPYEAFRSRLLLSCSFPLTEPACRAMYVHYTELAAWNTRLSLVGPGTWAEAVERHFAESLGALAWFEAGSAARVVDVGSGGGFPGLPLAAARPSLRVTLIESRQRKWAFLKAVARRASLPCRCLNARVTRTLPSELAEAFDAVLVRAVRLDSAEWSALFCGAPTSRFALAWVGREMPSLPPGLAVVREGPTAEDTDRKIIEIRNDL